MHFLSIIVRVSVMNTITVKVGVWVKFRGRLHEELAGLRQGRGDNVKVRVRVRVKFSVRVNLP